MTRRPTRTRAVPVRAERSRHYLNDPERLRHYLNDHERLRHYPNDYLHPDRPYEQTQSDIGGSLFLGAITLIALMALIVAGLA
jgi:hypothetical protein